MPAKKKKKDQVFRESSMDDILQDEQKKEYGQTLASNQNDFSEDISHKQHKNSKKNK